MFVTSMAIWALDNLGVNITALVAGLGGGGVAIALVTQSILGDRFASLSIVLDKPFVLGDFIVVGDAMGTIENIGLNTIRLRSLSGQEVIMSNADLLQSRTRNFKRMRERRIEFRFCVAVDTPAEILERIPNLAKELLSGEPGVRFDRAHFQAFSLDGPTFEVVYVAGSDDFSRFMDIQERLNLGIWRGLEALGTSPAATKRRTVIERRRGEAYAAVPGRKPALPRHPRAV